jgi:predicted nucleic acid-binding protein
MTNIFLDANVLISVVNQEYPLFTHSSRILSLVDHKKYSVYTSPLCLAITYYFSEKKSGRQKANEKMKILSEKLLITTVNSECVKRTVSNRNISDFEDGLEYYSAEGTGCTMIITENQKDFYFSKMNVTNCEGFFINYMEA